MCKLLTGAHTAVADWKLSRSANLNFVLFLKQSMFIRDLILLQ